MTVKEVIEELFKFDLESNVYVPDTQDGTCQIVKSVNGLVHVNCPEGISIPDDVTITPWSEEQFNDMHV